MIEPAIVLDGSATTDAVRAKLSGCSDLAWCVIRDESQGHVVWHCLDVGDLRAEIGSAEGVLPLREAIDLRVHRTEVRMATDWRRLRPRVRHTVILDGTQLVGVLPGEGHEVIPGIYRDWMPAPPPVGDSERPIDRFIAWPLVSAPSGVLAGDEFVLVIALSRERREASSPVAVDLLEAVTRFELEVAIAAVGLEAPAGWRHILQVDITGELPSISVPMRVLPDVEPGPLLIHVAFLHRGLVCGHATWPIAVGASIAAGMPGAVSPCSLPHEDEKAADLVIRILKADGNDATGRYVWSMSSTRAVIDTRPLAIELPDAMEFARTLMNNAVEFDGSELLESAFKGIGRMIAALIPQPFWTSLCAVFHAVAPEKRPPALLFVSAEQFIPWELALMEPPLEDGPPYLGVQTAIGRWLHSQTGAIPAWPPSVISLKDVAVLAPEYALNEHERLPHAVAEAKYMVETYGAIAVDATEHAVRRLLDGKIERPDGSSAEISVVHFACHGASDPDRPGRAGIYLSNGKRLTPPVFAASMLGSRFGPMLFINACEAGMAQRLLAADAGFAGLSLRGGFRGFIGPLWAVKDQAAAEIAHRFYTAILGGGTASVGEVLRAIRRSVAETNGAAFLAYTFYGHPRLRLQTEGHSHHVS